MSEFFQLLQANPILVFSGIVASILGFIIGIPLTVYLYKRGAKKRGLTYRVNSVRTSIVRAGAASRLAVLHDGREIKSDITAAHIAIWNQGRESIRQVDMLRPLILETADHTPILEATIQKPTHDVIGLRLDESKCDTGRLGVSWDILEERDGGIVQIIYAGSPDLQITAQAISEGQRKIIDCSQLLPPTRPGVRDRTIYLSVLLAFASGLVVLFGESAPFFQIPPFVGHPASLWDVGIVCLGAVGLAVYVVCMLWLLRRVRPPFEF